MNADGSVNFDELGRIIEDQIAHSTDAIVICGTTGESPTLTDEEHTACIRYAVEKNSGARSCHCRHWLQRYQVCHLAVPAGRG